jgi:hypothetical protein
MFNSNSLFTFISAKHKTMMSEQLDCLLTAHIQDAYPNYRMLKKWGNFVLIENNENKEQRIIGSSFVNYTAEFKDITFEFNHIAQLTLFSLSKQIERVCAFYQLPSFCAWCQRNGMDCFPEDYFNASDPKKACMYFFALMWAVKLENIAAIPLIVSTKPELLQMDNFLGETPFLFAIREFKHQSAILLFQMGSDINHRRSKLKELTWGVFKQHIGFKFENIYQFLACNGLTDMAEIMLLDGTISMKPFFEQNIHGVSPFMLAKDYGHACFVDMLQSRIMGREEAEQGGRGEV